MAFGTLGSTLNDELNRLANGGTYRDSSQMVDEALAAKQWANRENIVPYSTDTVGILNEIAALGPNRQNWFDFNGVCNYLAGTTGLPAAAALRQITTTGDILTSLAAFYTDATVGTNYIPTTASGYMYLPGVVSNEASTPDSAVLDVTGDIDIRVKFATTAWSGLGGSTYQNLIYKYSAGQKSYGFDLTPDGYLRIYWSTNGSSDSAMQANAIHGIANGDVKWVRVTLDVNNGASGRDAKFYTSDDGATWTQIGTTVTDGATTNIFASTSLLRIGDARGKFYRAQVRNGIDGTIVFDANFETAMTSQTVTSFTESSANAATVTVNRTTYNFQLDTLNNLGSAGALLPITVGSSLAADSNDAKFLDHTGTNYVYGTGVNYNYLSVPDSAALDITGDLDLRLQLALDDWTPATAQLLLSKRSGAGQFSYAFYLETSGTLNIEWSANGTASIAKASTVATGIPDGTSRWIRVTLDVDNGASGNSVQFFTSTDGSTWTQLGTTVTTAGVTSVFASTSSVEIGSQLNGLACLTGKVYRAQILNGIDGTKVLDVDTSVITSGADTYVVPTTYTGQAGAYFTGSGLSLNGVAGNYVSTPDSTPLDITGDIDIQVKVALTDWTPAAQTGLLSKDSTSNRSYYLHIASDGALIFGYTTDGTTVTQRFSTALANVTDGTTKWVRATMDVNNGAGGNDVKFYLSDDGTTWTQLGATVTNSGTLTLFNGTSPIYVGAGFNGANLANGTIYRAIVKSGIDGYTVFDADFTQVPANALRMTESSINKAVVTLNTTRYATINRSTSGRKTVAVTQPTWLFGTDDYMEVNNRYMAHSTSDENYVYLSGASGNYMTVSDTPPLSVAGDIDLRAKFALDDWSAVTNQSMLGKWSGGNRSYSLLVNSDSTLSLRWSANGSTLITKTSTVALSIADGATKWVRATLDVDNGASGNDVQFFTSDDGTNWTQLGATVTTAGTTSIFDGAGNLEIGTADGGTSVITKGKFFRAQVLNGINGPLVLDANAAVITLPSQTTFTDSSSNAYTVTINKSGVGTFVSTGNYLYLPGINSNHATTPDSAALDVTGDLDLRIKVAMDDWTPVGTTQTFLSKSAGVQNSYQFYMQNNKLTLFWSVNGTVSAGQFFTEAATADVSFVDGSIGWVRVTLDVNNGAGTPQYEVKFWTSTDGINWTQLGTTKTGTTGATSIFAGTANLYIGANNSDQATVRGKLFRAQVLNGIGGTVAFDANFEGSITSLNQASFTESSSNAATVTINRSGSTYRSAGVIDAGYLYPGATNTFSNSTIDYLNFGATDSFTVVTVSRHWVNENTGGNKTVISKKAGDFSTTAGYYLGYYLGTLYGSFADGATFQFPAAPGAFNNGALVNGVAIRNRTADTLQAYRNASAGTAETDNIAGSLSNINTLRIGRLGDPQTQYSDMEFIAAAVFRTVLTPAQIRQVFNYFINREAYL